MFAGRACALVSDAVCHLFRPMDVVQVQRRKDNLLLVARLGCDNLASVRSVDGCKASTSNRLGEDE